MSKISLLPPASPLDGSETVPIVQGGKTRGINPADHLAYIATGAELARDQAADLVLAQNIFLDVDQATAEAAVPLNTIFKLVSSSTGLAEVRRRSEAESDLLYNEVTAAALNSPDAGKGASLLKLEDGSTLQQFALRQPLQVDAFYEEADGDYWENAFTRAAVAAKVGRRSIACTPNASYRFQYSAEIWPLADGWVPPIIGNGAFFTWGAETPVIGNEYAGFRYRGLKSGALANPIKPAIRDITIDAQNIAFSNGVRSIAMENASEWEFIRVHGRNYMQGMHISNFRYADGGDVTGKPGFVSGCIVSGNVLSGTTGGNSKTWYPYHEAGDLATGMPGDSIPNGAKTAIACALSGVTGNNVPKQAEMVIFSNDSGGSLVVPASHLKADIVSAGFTEIGTSAILPSNGSLQPANIYMCYTTGGAKTATSVILGVNNLVEDCDFMGGRYSAYVSGAIGARFRNIEAAYGIRGLAFEWGAANAEIHNCNIREPLSSGVLFSYDCGGWKVNFTHVEALTDRWVGEGLFNFQIGCGNGFGRGNSTETNNNVTAGQTHVHIATNSSDIDFECDMRGDCIQGYVVIESAATAALESTIPELHKGGVAGAASQDMSNIRISGSITPVSSKAVGAGATMVALLQVSDTVYGEIGLSRVDISDLRAGRSKVPVRYLKIYENDGLTEGVADPAKRAKQVNDCLLWNVEFPVETSATTAATRMILPRKWAHFRKVKNVTNMDDEVERIVPNVATPDLTFGKYWWDTGTTTLNGILGGQGVASTEGYEGREIVVRGNNSREWADRSVTSGTRDGLRLTGTPITPTSVQRMVLRYSRGQASWIGGLT